MATPEEELRKWTAAMLISEIRKQIRRDFGGRSEDWVLAWIITELKGKTPKEQAIWVHQEIGKHVKGSRDRIESKLIELGRRLAEQEKRIKELEAELTDWQMGIRPKK
jgi:hypothetical protein